MHRARAGLVKAEHAAPHELRQALLEGERAVSPRDRDLLVQVLQRVLPDMLSSGGGSSFSEAVPP